ncbi:MAG: translation initiation factor IF-2 [Candidatus Omnitrophica bacterium]|nr:translation initiation factor IF-2 [Candidatus Omnitrophota bacterium]
MRIYELSKQLGIDSKELIEKLQKLNFPVKSHMSVVDDDTAEIIKHEVADLNQKEIEENVIDVDFPITVKDLAVKLNQKPSEILKILMSKGKMAMINQTLDNKLAQEIAYSFKINLRQKPSKEEEILQVGVQELKKRAPVVTLMGHIDHGKTSLLDYIRKSTITQSERGGITQHIGAYRVDLEHGSITFVDTPGHETFTAMRARGADITDIVILVVAAEEGIKPQTIEAYDHAKQADVPIIVAINKIDLPTANVDMVKQQLSKIDLVPEDWGGKTVTQGVSAKTGAGVNELLELILLQGELLDLKADYGRPAVGVVIEGHLSKGRGALATILVQEGQLSLGDIVVCGVFWGRIKAMQDDLGRFHQKVYPSCPIEVLGLDGVPTPGDKLFVVPDESSAKEIIDRRKEEEKNKRQTTPAHMRLEDLGQKGKKQLKVILKADVGGTLEAVEQALGKLSTQEVESDIVHKAVGAISPSDVLLSEVSDAVIFGFKVGVDASARDLAKQKGIEIRTYQIVYELIDEVRSALEGMLTPHIRRVFIGQVQVKKVFKLSKGIIAGSIVTKGKVQRGAQCELMRQGEKIFSGRIDTLKRFKDEVKEVTEGTECGLGIGYDQLEEGDLIDVFREEKIERKLS